MAHTTRKGFTLVELMIVIAIIGLLAVALLPKLTGAQAGARDTARKASLQAIATGLAAYKADRNAYPSLSGASANDSTFTGAASSGCVSNSAGSSATWLLEKMDGKKLPLDPQSRTVTTCGVASAYGYVPMTSAGLTNNAFVLVASMETYQKANSQSGTSMTVATITGSNYETLTSGTLATLSAAPAAKATTAGDDVFIITKD